MLIETHCHLDFPQFDEDRPQTIQRAQAAGIQKFINIGTTVETNQKSLELANQFPDLYLTLGIHPCSANQWSTEVEENFNKELKENPKALGVGETGLDFFRETNPPKEIQEKAFRAQIQLAKKHQKPFVVHSRNQANQTWKDQNSAAAQIYQILQEEDYYNCVFHCFAEDLEFAQKLWSRGVYTSFNGTITYPQNEDIREVAKNCPSHLYILETDCPFLPPQDKRGKQNEPAYIKDFAQYIADLRNTTLEEVSQQTTSNAQALFKFPPE